MNTISTINTIIFIYRYESPWRIVFPAIYFNFIFAIISMYAYYNLQQGYKSFNDGIINISYEIYSICKVPMNIRYQI